MMSQALPAADPPGTLARRLWLCASCVVLLDSLLSYFSRAWAGHGLQVNAILPLLILPALAASSVRRFVPPMGALVAFMLGYFGFVVGLFSFDIPTLNRLTTFSSGFAAFIVGYALTMHLTEGVSRQWQGVLFLIGAAYVGTCVGALLKVAPALLPTLEALRMRDGELVLRPEVTTDQNFQIFYLLPCVIPLVFAKRLSVWTLTVFAACLAALWILAQLQTRSGAIIFAFAMVLVGVAVFRRSRHKATILIVGGFGAAAVLAVSVSLLTQLLAPLIDRFTKDDFSTAEGRLWSAAYLVQHILTPSWWIPQGNEAFRRLAGGEVPHFNGTAFFLEGGLPGLYCWLALHVYPTLHLMYLFFRGRLTPTGEAVAVMAASTLLASMTLNVPYVELVWMWAGAAVAVRVNPALSRDREHEFARIDAGAAASDATRGRLPQQQFGNLMR